MTVTDATSPYEQLKADLGYLQLGRAAECFATVAEQAKAELQVAEVGLELLVGAGGIGHRHAPSPVQPHTP